MGYLRCDEKDYIFVQNLLKLASVAGNCHQDAKSLRWKLRDSDFTNFPKINKFCNNNYPNFREEKKSLCTVQYLILNNRRSHLFIKHQES